MKLETSQICTKSKYPAMSPATPSFEAPAGDPVNDFPPPPPSAASCAAVLLPVLRVGSSVGRLLLFPFPAPVAFFSTTACRNGLRRWLVPKDTPRRALVKGSTFSFSTAASASGTPAEAPGMRVAGGGEGMFIVPRDDNPRGDRCRKLPMGDMKLLFRLGGVLHRGFGC